MNAIEFLRVTKIYKKGFRAIKVPAVVDCSFSVSSGAITGFIGPNGAGKTTSIKMILGLVRPTSGVIKVLGKNPDDPACRKDIAFLSEQPYFYNHLTVGETLLFAARLHGVNSANVSGDIEASLSRVGLQGLKKRKIKDLSKGMQQRCAMAQALLMRSNTLVLDEPLSGLDPPGRTLFRSILLSLAETGVTIFLSTHILDDIELMCQNVVVLSHGRLEYQGSISELLKRGFKGTDLVIPRCSESFLEQLRREGCEIAHLSGEKTRVFVPIGKDVLHFQKLLLEHGVLCESILKRTVPLEEILYKN